MGWNGQELPGPRMGGGARQVLCSGRIHVTDVNCYSPRLELRPQIFVFCTQVSTVLASASWELRVLFGNCVRGLTLQSNLCDASNSRGISAVRIHSAIRIVSITFDYLRLLCSERHIRCHGSMSLPIPKCRTSSPSVMIYMD